MMSGKDLSNTSRTNWAALEAMEDEGIDYSDIPPLTEEFFEKATLSIPALQAPLDDTLSDIIPQLLELPPEEFTRLLLQLSREELLDKFIRRLN